MQEIWKDIKGWEGLYQVSNLGRVKSLNYNKEKTSKVLRTKKARGYDRVCLCRKGYHKYISVHRVVAMMFVPNPDNKPEVNHIDGNKSNNTVNNLEWVTSRENTRHSIAVLGHNPRIWSRTAVKCVETGEIFETQTEAAEAYHTSQGAIGNAARGNRPRAGGHHWCFIDTV